MKTIRFIVLGLVFFLLNSCAKYTDIIDPKGKNLLSTVDELDYLLNVNMALNNGFYMQNLYALTNDMYLTTVSNILSGDKNMNYTILTYDETADRADLQKVDIVYEQLYALIGARLNVVLGAIDKVSGDPEKAKRIKAEALTLRAYIHYILVNIYAKSYNSETAESDGGIAYMDKTDFEKSPVKESVAAVYHKILNDLQEAEDLNALYDLPQVPTRASKILLYTFKAEVLRTLTRYPEAIEYADKALKLNNILEDHRPYIATGLAVRDNRTATDNIFLAANKVNNPTFNVPSVETMEQYYEPGNIIRYYTSTYSYTVAGVNYSVQLGTQYAFEGALLYYNNSYQQNASGMTVSDLYFIKAESLIHSDRIADGVAILNYVKERRTHPSQYKPIEVSSKDEAMKAFKKLSRIEFLMTWKNFVNLKRWNRSNEYKETISRTINGKTYTLTPESPLWTFPFPQSATNYNSNLAQNY
ncbi:MAG: RagB/SusD family nutrient uptake outer membrane protein [Sphingobacterium sp.]|jgi:tetratricopeptide (TPR) repeat protein|nr:RagB/SusD family nutrient uptake outer membrane protein [Sphingobacterium sp.]